MVFARIIGGRIIFRSRCRGLVVRAVGRRRVCDSARIGHRFAIAIRVVFGMGAFSRGTRMAASTATVWASAFCHELENMMRDNIERGGRDMRP